MISKFKLTLLLFFIVKTSISQVMDIKGLITDSTTSDGIPDVMLIVNNEIKAYSNEKGFYEFQITADIDSEIMFSHMSYVTKSLPVNKLKKEPNISLSINFENLDEIVIVASKSISKKQLLQNIVEQFNKTIRKSPFKSDTNLKQINALNDSIISFLEIDGKMIHLGKNKSVWNHPILIPKKVRRTKDVIINKAVHFGLNSFTDQILSMLRFFEVRHPLSKKGHKKYDFILENNININGKDYYVFNYYSKEEVIKIVGRDFKAINGQLIVDKNTLDIEKISSIFIRPGKNSAFNGNYKFSINYTIIEQIVYQQNINYDVFTTFESKKSQTSLKTIGQIFFDNINTNKSVYKDAPFSNRYLFKDHSALNHYDKNYWKNRTLFCCGLESKGQTLFSNSDSDSLFYEGVNFKIINDRKAIQTMNEEEAVLRLLKL